MNGFENYVQGGLHLRCGGGDVKVEHEFDAHEGERDEIGDVCLR